MTKSSGEWRLREKAADKLRLDDRRPQISIVVPTYNPKRIHSLVALLESIRAQQCKELETIVVAEADREVLADIRRRIGGDRFPNVSVILSQGQSGASAARNVGITAARGAIVAFVDDDAELTPGWAQAVIQTYTRYPSVAGVVGSVEPLWESREDSWLPRELYWIIGCTGWLGDITSATLATGPGTSISFRREVLSETGVFAPVLGQRGSGDEWRERGALAEDAELCMRVQVRTGQPLLVNAQIRVQHRVPHYKLSIKWIAYRSYQVGRSRAMLRRLYPRRVGSLRSLEQDLVKRLALFALPEVLYALPRDPWQAWLKLRALMIAVVFVMIGYATYLVWPTVGGPEHLGIECQGDGLQ